MQEVKQRRVSVDEAVAVTKIKAVRFLINCRRSMSSLVLEESTIDQLRTVEAPVEVRDAAGSLIGFFYPAITPATADQYECPVSEEELLRRARQGGGRPLADILRDLRSES